PLGEEPDDAAMQRGPRRNRARLSSVPDYLEHWLASAGFDRGPWLAIAFGGGIALWFVLGTPAEWVLAMAASLLAAVGALALWKGREDRIELLRSAMTVGLVLAMGIGVAWARSGLVGVPALERPTSAVIAARVLERIEQPAEDRIRLVLAAREPGGERAVKLRVNVPLDKASPAMTEGADIRLRARLMPPAPPMLPGGYDFARSAWFQGLAATGSVQGEIEV